MVPALAPALLAELAGPGGRRPHGVKLFLGGRAGDDVAEVRVDGEVSEAASAALRALDWPRGERLCWARLFVLLTAHGEPLAPAAGTEGAEPARPAAVAAARPQGLFARWRQARRADR